MTDQNERNFRLLNSIFPPILREKFFLFTFILSQYCPTVKQILPDWPSLPNNRGPPRSLMARPTGRPPT